MKCFNQNYAKVVFVTSYFGEVDSVNKVAGCFPLTLLDHLARLTG